MKLFNSSLVTNCAPQLLIVIGSGITMACVLNFRHTSHINYFAITSPHYTYTTQTIVGATTGVMMIATGLITLKKLT